MSLTGEEDNFNSPISGSETEEGSEYDKGSDKSATELRTMKKREKRKAAKKARSERLKKLKEENATNEQSITETKEENSVPVPEIVEEIPKPEEIQDDFIAFIPSEDEHEEEVEQVQTSKKRKRSVSPDNFSKDLPPWIDPSAGKERFGGEVHRVLHKEVKEFVEYISATPEEHEIRYMAVKRIEKTVRSLWPRARVYIFGSYDTRLYLPTSDLDLVIFMYGECPKEKKRLWLLASALKSRNVAHSINVIAKARVPIIKCVETITNFNVDICIDIESGIQSASIVKRLVKEIPGVRPLTLILKQFLMQRGMNEVYNGGLGSYATLLLVVSFLQLHPKVQSGEINPEENLGVLLIEFFELYGKNFNYVNTGISINNEGSYFRKDLEGWQNQKQNYLLSIEDPQDADNDVSKGTHGILRVRKAFGGAYDVLTTNIFEHYRDSSRRHRRSDRPFSLLNGILKISTDTLKHRERIAEVYCSQSLHRELGVDGNVGLQEEIRKRVMSKDPPPTPPIPASAHLNTLARSNKRPTFSDLEFVPDESDSSLDLNTTDNAGVKGSEKHLDDSDHEEGEISSDE
ncbi:Poly(A) polymerase [Basidiobolus ranarum]|uniref:polynucleotide adenylyltransferase n=1 Tax=Basidiobolus ranarum TaxID=34480 RepID=A0ABR2X2E4_9FUNG